MLTSGASFTNVVKERTVTAQEGSVSKKLLLPTTEHDNAQ